jgi:hypothetical protein
MDKKVLSLTSFKDREAQKNAELVEKENQRVLEECQKTLDFLTNMVKSGDMRFLFVAVGGRDPHDLATFCTIHEGIPIHAGVGAVELLKDHLLTGGGDDEEFE